MIRFFTNRFVKDPLIFCAPWFLEGSNISIFGWHSQSHPNAFIQQAGSRPWNSRLLGNPQKYCMYICKNKICFLVVGKHELPYSSLFISYMLSLNSPGKLCSPLSFYFQSFTINYKYSQRIVYSLGLFLSHTSCSSHHPNIKKRLKICTSFKVMAKL